jgi:tripartite-type tricarboxylate transporter receptor subunit TctC
MRRFILIALSLIVYTVGLTISTVQSQPYPNRPIQLIDPMDPGTTGDITGRLLAEELGKILGTQIIVINKPGASMTLGTDVVVRSKKDGYTIGYTNTSAIIYAKVSNPDVVPYDPFKDLEPLGLHVFFSNVIAVQGSSPWKTFSELVDYARKYPEKVRVGTPGIGSTSHFCLAMTETLTGAKFTHIPLKGTQSMVTNLLGGHLEVIVTAPSQVIPFVDEGKARALLVSKKMPQFPNVPTLTDLGYKQDLLSAWFALYAPAGVSEEVKKVLVPAVEKAIKTPELRPKIEKLGFIIDYKSPAELKKIMAEDYETAYAIAVKIGLRK